MSDAIDIGVGDYKLVLGLLKQHLPNVAVWAYGSRVKWTARPQSDLDLVAFTSCEQEAAVFNLREALEESSLPFSVDLFIWDELPESFRKQIEAEHVVLVVGKEKDVRGGWKTATLGELTDNFDSVRVPVKRADRRPGPYPYYGASGIVDSVNDYLFDGEYLLIAEDGENLRTRNTPIAFLANGKFWVNNHAHIVRGNRKANTRYLMYALSELDVSGYLTGSTMPKLTQGNMNRISLLTPPMSEQRAIAHILGTLDDKIELNRRMNETLEEMARALFKSWFVDFDPVRAKMEGRDTGLPPDVAALFPDRLVESELGEIPEGWEVKALGELIELAYGKALKADDRKSGSIPVYGSNGQVGWHDKKLAAGPGIVVGRKGNPGIVTWAYRDFFPIDTTFYVIPRDTDGDLPFLFFALTAQDLPSVAADSAVPGLNRNLAYMNRQLVPDKQVVEEFSHYASAIFTRQHRLEEESRTLAAQRDALLPKLISGEMRVNTRDEESEAVIGKYQ